MADIGRLLLLPPPAQAGRAAPARPGEVKAGADPRANGAIAARVDEAADSTANARGKQFRFRVLDGGRNDLLAGNAEVPAHTDPNAEIFRDQTAAIGRTPAGGATGGSVPFGTPLAAFLAQLIAQEQLPPGLYDPPVRAADRAYRQAGAEPPLDNSVKPTAGYRIAV